MPRAFHKPLLQVHFVAISLDVYDDQLVVDVLIMVCTGCGVR